MLDIIATFTVVEKITLLAWNAKFQTQAAKESVQTNHLEFAPGELEQGSAAAALIAGLCTGHTTDQELLDLVVKMDYPAQLENILDCRTQQELDDMEPDWVAAFQLCVRLGLLDAWEPW